MSLKNKRKKKSWYYYVKVYIKKISKYFIIIFSNCVFSVKTTFKQWLQVFKSVNWIFLLIKLIPNFYDMYIMYSK
jgi:hypothetical protein